ncbi:MAG: transposase [Alphaproteobacteria bacterium]|jgi:transposase|nr:transposase [Alphaproteobacteria bacterium]
MPLIEGITGSFVLVDKGYDDDRFIKAIEDQGCKEVIPSIKEPREYDKDVYKEHHLIECFFGKIKYFRGIFSRFDKTAQAYMGFLNVAAIFIWLK